MSERNTKTQLMMETMQLTVGKKFDHDIPDEGMSIVLVNGAPLLTFNFSVTKKHIDCFLNGSASFGLFNENDTLFFLFKIDKFLDWSDLAFTIHLAGDEKVEDNEGYLPFHLVLVESKTSIIKGLRVVTVSPAFRALLSRITRQQANEKFDTITYYKKIGAAYKAYPSASDMLKKALIIEKGGVTLPK
ncbi:hypothetical protein GO003_012705 [Methylicorpusculum oleiharenae]|uniref:hypothetical protein n=1 Tax=Methylicorpusculum oleiharenae TaxID=1338687 RepID=UPI001E654B86|nr:hypothetical protein [Methylicorpusculum oleiharenae]MCD2451254.1 hypothetical protein [Methylicorpusculum oleiharenae]